MNAPSGRLASLLRALGRIARSRALIIAFVALVPFAIVFAIAAAVWFVAPEWWAVPGELFRMTGQEVPREPEPPAEPEVAQEQPTEPAARQPSPTRPAQTSTPRPSPTVRPTDTPPSLPSPRLFLPARRFNVLLLGSDNDKKFSPDAVLTQSMIIVSIDPTTHDVAMISIPRDSWVPISGYGYAKISVAYQVGGIALARSTVERLFGVKIDYYAWVGLDGLVNVIDTLGGVDVTVQHPVLDEAYPDDLVGPDPYAYYRLYIPAGPQHLDGTTALEYVRSRHGDLQSDFGRSARQQQVLVAIKRLVTGPSVLGRVPQLAASLQSAVKTDFTLPQIIALAALARDIPEGNIHRQILSAPEFASLGWSPDYTQQIVIPDWPSIRPEVSALLHIPASSIAGAPAQGTTHYREPGPPEAPTAPAPPRPAGSPTVRPPSPSMTPGPARTAVPARPTPPGVPTPLTVPLPTTRPAVPAPTSTPRPRVPVPAASPTAVR